MTETTVELDEQIAQLPADVQDAIRSVDTVAVLRELTKKHRLHIDQAANLSSEVARIMLGQTSPRSFVGNVASRVGIDTDTAKSITAELNNKVFKNIRESLKKIHRLEEESASADSSETEYTVVGAPDTVVSDLKTVKEEEPEENAGGAKPSFAAIASKLPVSETTEVTEEKKDAVPSIKSGPGNDPYLEPID